MLGPHRAASLQPQLPVPPDASVVNHGGSSLPWLFEQVRDFSLLAKVAGTNGSCTQCLRYDSTIFLRNQKPRAGLHDRFIIMYHALALANSLCARLAIGPPSRLLSRRHNNNVFVNGSWWWGRYFAWDLVKDIDSIDWTGEPRAQCNQSTVTHDGGAAYLCSLNATSAQEHAAQAEALVLEGRTFVWDINVNWWHMERSLRYGVELPLLRTADEVKLRLARRSGDNTDPNSLYAGYPRLRTGGCFFHTKLGEHLALADPWRPEILASFESRLVAGLAATARQALGVAPESLYTLHVRRSDTVPDCNTSVVSVVEHMRCSDSRWGAAGGSDVLVVFTDETDPHYIDMLTTSLGHLPRWAGRVRHGDRIVRGVMTNDADRSDNYLLYMVESLMAWAAVRSFELRRCRGEASCEDEGDKYAELRSGLRTSVEQAVARQKIVKVILTRPAEGASARVRQLPV